MKKDYIANQETWRKYVNYTLKTTYYEDDTGRCLKNPRRYPCIVFPSIEIDDWGDRTIETDFLYKEDLIKDLQILSLLEKPKKVI